MMDYNASITYRNPVPAMADRAARGDRASTGCSGMRCPVCERVYVGGDAATARSTRSSSARSTRSTCRTPGTITNFTIITPVQYPGQTETEPFARVFVLLDGTDVVLGYQPVVELPVERRARRHAGRARCGPRRPRRRRGGQRHRAARTGSLIGWMPTGEPDVDDPDLVNRIF